MHYFKNGLILFGFLLFSSCHVTGQIPTNSNMDWKFRKIDNNESDASYHLNALDVSSWDDVSLPHTANLEPLLVNDQWQGICWYRKNLALPEELKNKKIFLEWEGAMHVAEVFINGKLIEKHTGGYLPIIIDATSHLKFGGDNMIAIRLDNQDNPLTGPKPLKILDFNMYGGLYREHNVIIKNKLYISHPNLAKKVAGGGLFITTPEVSKEKATVNVKAHVINEYDTNQAATIKHTILYEGEVIAKVETKLKPKQKNKRIKVYRDLEVNSELSVDKPKLWHPKHPHLYHLLSEVLIDGKVVDSQKDRFGIRQFEFKGMDLYINGEKTFLRGTNRHQEYPFIGYALSDNAQYRDAKKIKDAGFDYIRLSHYPHSPAFMDACDELGLVVTDAILGWQYYKDDDRFRAYCYNSTRQLIRRDRNHPSVLLWEASLNETAMPEFFMEMLNTIVHHEYPGEHVYTAGWKDYAYDVYFQARQHKIKHDDYNHKHTRPYAVSEYGDWEYYSNNAGLNQDKLDKTLRYETSSRQARAFGESRLLNQLKNVHESHNDNFTTPAFADSYWVMYDYNRGYHPDIEYSGISDIFRIEKFAYYFYKSQRTPDEEIVLNIASFWTDQSPTDVKVLSNCDEVALYLNDELIARQKPDTDKFSTHIPQPPFTFQLGTFKAGTLRAVGYINGNQVTEYVVHTPQKPTQLQLRLDESGRAAESGVNDVLFLYISAVDANGTVDPMFSDIIDLKIDGDIEIINPGEIKAEAGIATALIRIGKNNTISKIKAISSNLKGDLILDIK